MTTNDILNLIDDFVEDFDYPYCTPKTDEEIKFAECKAIQAALITLKLNIIELEKEEQKNAE